MFGVQGLGIEAGLHEASQHRWAPVRVKPLQIEHLGRERRAYLLSRLTQPNNKPETLVLKP